MHRACEAADIEHDSALDCEHNQRLQDRVAIR